VRGVKLFYKAEYCGTLQSKERSNREYKVCLNERALRLLDQFSKGQNDVKSILTTVYGDFSGPRRRENKANMPAFGRKS